MVNSFVNTGNQLANVLTVSWAFSIHHPIGSAQEIYMFQHEGSFRYQYCVILVFGSYGP